MGGAEQRIRRSQFGFRPRRSTLDAISVLRRLFDATYEKKQQ